jgi:hypothetical protein
MLAPICLFTYNRLYETKQTLEALQKNFLAHQSDLFIFSDGPQNDNEKLKVEAVRDYIGSVKGFKSVEIIESEKNNGLANSIINGVTRTLEKYDNVIVLEDDLITSPNFLDFINQALTFYRQSAEVQSIGGYSLSLSDKSQEVNFQTRAFSWGWATWRDRWHYDIFDKEKLKEVINTDQAILKEFKKKCGADMPKMLMDSLNNVNDSWYVRWTFNHFRSKRYAVFPAYSFINNIGHNMDATHCKGINTYVSVAVNPQKTTFTFPSFSPPDLQSNKEFLSYFSLKHKIRVRLKLLKNQNGRKQLFNEVKMRLGLNIK